MLDFSRSTVRFEASRVFPNICLMSRTSLLSMRSSTVLVFPGRFWYASQRFSSLEGGGPFCAGAPIAFHWGRFGGSLPIAFPTGLDYK